MKPSHLPPLTYRAQPNSLVAQRVASLPASLSATSYFKGCCGNDMEATLGKALPPGGECSFPRPLTFRRKGKQRLDYVTPKGLVSGSHWRAELSPVRGPG